MLPDENGIETVESRIMRSPGSMLAHWLAKERQNRGTRFAHTIEEVVNDLKKPGTNDLAAGAGDQRPEHVQVDRVLEEPDRAIGDQGMETARMGRAGAIERGLRGRVERQVFGLGPGNRFLRFDDHERVRRAVGDVGDAVSWSFSKRAPCPRTPDRSS